MQQQKIKQNLNKLFRILYDKDARLRIGPVVGTNKFETIYTEIDLIWHNNLIQKDKSCTDYNSLKLTNEECEALKLEELLKEELGSLPPWIKTAQDINLVQSNI